MHCYAKAKEQWIENKRPRSITFSYKFDIDGGKNNECYIIHIYINLCVGTRLHTKGFYQMWNTQ